MILPKKGDELLFEYTFLFLDIPSTCNTKIITPNISTAKRHIVYNEYIDS